MLDNNKLPKVYVNTITNEIKNNKEFFYSSNERSANSRGSDVEILLDTGKVRKTIVKRNKIGYVTIDNEVIKYSDIIDINYID